VISEIKVVRLMSVHDRLTKRYIQDMFSKTIAKDRCAGSIIKSGYIIIAEVSVQMLETIRIVPGPLSHPRHY
jgi:hypothetical protein